jgi:hypothetical protein
MLKRLPLLIAVLSCLTITLTISARAKDEEWIRSHKTDNIETFYQVEKIGTNELEVRIKVVNGRSKEVRVWLEIVYEGDGYARGMARVNDDHSRETFCILTIPTRGSDICKIEKIKAKKIVDVRIERWLNEDVAKIEDKENKKRYDDLKKRRPRVPR